MNSQICVCGHHQSSHGMRNRPGCSRCWCGGYRQSKTDITGDARPDITK